MSTGPQAGTGPDPETPLSDAEHTLGQVRENAESLLMNPDPVVQWCARQVLAAAGVPAPPLPPAEARAVADLVAVEGAAAVLERRYPGGRPDVLEAVLGELHAVVRVWRRMAAEAGKRTEGDAVIDMGYLSLPAELQQDIEQAASIPAGGGTEGDEGRG